MSSNAVQVLQSAAFSRIYKKPHKNQKADVDVAVAVTDESPELSESKRGDLAGVYVYKSKSQNQLMLLVSEHDPNTRLLLLLVSHEKFCRDLKR